MNSSIRLICKNDTHRALSSLASLEEFQKCGRMPEFDSQCKQICCMRVVTLPREIKIKKAVINVQSMDNACFAWSVVAALHPVEITQIGNPHIIAL